MQIENYVLFGIFCKPNAPSELLKCRKNNFTFEEKVKKTKTAIFFPPRI
jgi:hypothetical protein